MKTYCWPDIDLHIDALQYHTLQNTCLGERPKVNICIRQCICIE